MSVFTNRICPRYENAAEKATIELMKRGSRRSRIRANQVVWCAPHPQIRVA